jgi:transcription-repair coupling factor (superfamily II helicase)
VGFDLYTELLDEAIRELRGKKLTPEETYRDPEIKAPFPSFLSEEYVPDVHQRLSLYRRLSASAGDEDLRVIEEELKDRFGPLPMEAQNLLWLIRIKQVLKSIGIETLVVGPERISLVSSPSGRLDPARAIALVASNPSKFQLTPDSKFVAKLPTGSLRDLFFALENLLKDLLPRKAS